MSATLNRRIGLGLLTAYGVGVMVGAGIYVLVGAVAAQTGIYAPLAFLIAGLVALPSALSFAELSARMPEAGGEVAYVEAGFGSRGLAALVGLAVVVGGTISAAAVLRGGVGYLTGIVAVEPWVAIFAGGVILTAIAIKGVLESLVFAAVLTVIEVLGLILIVFVAFGAEPSAAYVAPEPFQPMAILGAVALCFFAFIGFEDLVNMAEEVKDPTRIMPRGILLALVITALLYGLVTWSAIRVVEPNELGTSDQPLALVYEVATGKSAVFLSGIAVIAAANGILAQIVMASRVLLGLGRRFRGISIFAVTGESTGTPVIASILVGGAVTAAAMALPVSQLAQVTSSILLVIFVVVNASLIVIKRKSPDAPFRTPSWVPVLGLVLALAAIAMTLGAGGAGH